ncbi:enoyl-CoA hydratase/isomerase family protein [Hydrogenophaga sp.]|uniref:enoyl-CoA hydratase/isomerase family protein n=1 Tax=Hydrogenophaga sp. TaxID=1904254 RepID=UPI003F6EE877
MNHPDLLVSQAGAILSVALNRPDKLNAIHNGMALGLLQVIDAAGADDSVRVLLLRGAGRAFCAGRDLSAPPTEDDLVLVQGVAQALVSCPKPVVAAVHGWTLGAGLEWMLDCDVVMAADTARFRLPEASLGVFVTGGLAATLAASAGLMRAKSLMLLGDEFSASQAQAWGLVGEVVNADALEAAAQRTCERLASLAPEVAAQFKKVLNEVGLSAFAQAITLENAAQRSLGSG